jgi:predicted nucleic acid-binding protein
MNGPRKLVLDANILLRAAFGRRVHDLLKRYENSVEFYSPDSCIEEALNNIPTIAVRQRIDAAFAKSLLTEIVDEMILVVDRVLYEEFEVQARSRISMRDADDWPVVAVALMLDTPIWTEDNDFFGCGIATWTSDRIELYLRDA